MDCPRKYHYNYNQRLSSKMYLPPLGYGTFIHAFAERLHGGDPDAPDLALAHELKLYPNDEARMRQDFALAKLVSDIWSDYWDKTQMETFSNKNLQFLEAEREWAMDIDYRQRQIGKRDGYVRLLNHGKNALYELKTSGDTSRETYKHRLSLDKQINANVLALVLEGKPCDAIVYDIIWKPALRLKTGRKTMPDETQEELNARILEAYASEPAEYFERLLVFRHRRDLDEYRIDAMAQFDTLASVSSRDVWYRNTGACENYGRLCQYFNHCMDSTKENEEQFRLRDRKHPEISKDFQLKQEENVNGDGL